MPETTELKCEVCGEIMIAKLNPALKNNVYIHCPSMLHDHDIYVVPIR